MNSRSAPLTPLNSRSAPLTPPWLVRAATTAATLVISDQLLVGTTAQASLVPLHVPSPAPRFRFHYEQVLGTSLSVNLDGLSASAGRAAETAILGEIRRLELALSTYDPGSEISRVQAGQPVESRELAEVFAAYDLWSARTEGAISRNLAGVIALWKNFAAGGPLPDAADLAAASAQPRAFNIDALGKGYVVDRAVTVARRFAPSGMINLGGDLRVWGEQPWQVGIADPRSPADNAAPLLHFLLKDGAVATSADYARSFEAAGRRYSHLIDPRTLRPTVFGLSATVVASDCLTANALSTAATILGAAEGSALARNYGRGHLFFAAATAPAPSSAQKAAASPGAWPSGFQVNVEVALKSSGGGRYKRPYVAVWIETPAKKVVRTLTIWGRQGRYLPELTQWWHATGGNHAVIDAVSRATRQAGAYTLAWDGLDDRGQPVPAGDYKIFVEINREHGHHVVESVTLNCAAQPATVELSATAESLASAVKYGPKPTAP